VNGTHVAGRHIGGKRRTETLLLEQSETRIVLGNEQSPWHFRVLIPGGEARYKLLIANDAAPMRSVLRATFLRIPMTLSRRLMASALFVPVWMKIRTSP